MPGTSGKGFAMRQPYVLAAAMAMLLAPAAQADFIGVSDGRVMTASVGIPSIGGVNVSTSPNSPFAPWDAELISTHPVLPTLQLTHTTQNSSFSSSLLEGSGTADWLALSTDGSASTTYRITFDVDSSTPFVLTGTLYAQLLLNDAFSNLSLKRGATVIYSAAAVSGPLP